MSEATRLMQALLGPGTSVPEAQAALEEALLSEADPMLWCAIQLGLSDAEIMRRAATWMDLAYFDGVPRGAQVKIKPRQLEMLGEVRLFRLRILDREVAFAAPDFFGVLRLAQTRQNRPELRRLLCLVPPSALRDFMVHHAGDALIDGARQTMTRYWPHAAAQLDLTSPVRKGFVIFLLVLAALVILAPLLGQGWLAPLWIALVLLPATLRLLALAMPPEPVHRADSREDRSSLPVYTVLVPLRDEANMVAQLVATLGRLDYPPEKLDIIFVVEGRSPATVRAVRQHLGDVRFSLLVVPDAMPRTKPKALDFALPLCRGEFLVVFDAEDRPEPDQLRRVVAQFRRQIDVACIQARLVIDNGGEGALPAIFAGEYAGLFAVLLPALARWGQVMPLGGTSNHFRTETLRRLGGWDAFNVTEDADLGVRLARRQLRCATTTSRTYESAPVGVAPWMGQRTRWMKGWMQTYVVHNRRPDKLLADLGWQGTLMLQIILLGMLLSPLLYVGYAVVLLVLAFKGQLAWPEASIWPIACTAVLVIGHAVAITTNVVGLRRTGQSHLMGWQALLPGYWLLIGLATLLALREFTLRPFHWFKSPHVASAMPAPMPAAEPLPAQAVGKRAQRLGRKAILDRSTAG
ncbi:glycosyltransferase [Devosia sp. XJ19-1]|uniref:Glycosyltransferase n=1 Tax=Devosia ureilytica TaxID=2952754 RepID=A0A9Q4FSP2_9HYPH|nr:glycosyltransferase [Devosia ureilytica]MCP8885078.1 glycosyltransferase [Devosia ureilytica]MCP8888801.1 glycosyltransferase [Devosia ureilytica]